MAAAEAAPFLCTVTGALSGEVLATLPVSIGESVGEIAKRSLKLLPPRERTFDDVESYALTFDGVALDDEECVLMLDGVALEAEMRMDAALLARVVAGDNHLQLLRRRKQATVVVSASCWNLAKMSDGTAALRYAS
jgi:hypothetical protein